MTVKSAMVGSNIKLETEGKDGECSFNFKWCKLEKIRGESEGANAVLGMMSRRVNVGMRDKCTKVSTFKEVSGQSTSSRFCQWQI